MQKSKSLKSPLASVKGLGSSHHGTEHWMAQKVTAIANIPLMVWFVYSMVGLVGASYAEFSAWLSLPVNAILMILMVISTFYHARLGGQVIVEDYISNKALKTVKLIGEKLILFALAVACIFSILKVAL